MIKHVKLIPTFDLWFWVLFVWALAIPYLWDASHADKCDSTGTVTFLSLSSVTRTYLCTLQEGKQ